MGGACAACQALACCCSMCSGITSCCRGCGCDGCRKASQCGVRFNRFFYLGMFLIPLIVTIVFLFHPEYFMNDFWRAFPAYKNISLKYSFDWITNIRFVFTYFAYHSMLLVFSLFGLCPSTTPVAKIMHRGLIFIKIPFLVGFYFLSYVFPNEAMFNFQFLSYAIGATFLAVITIYYVSIGYSFVNGLFLQQLGVRVIALIFLFLFYILAALCYVFMYLHSTNVNVLGTTVVTLILNLVIIILTIANKHSSSFPTAFMVFLHAFHYIYAANLCFDEFNSGKWSFTRDCFYAFAAFGSIFNLIAIVTFNIVELSLQPLLVGINSGFRQDFGTLVSTLEDDDMQSTETTYHYWAFHLIMMGASCYLSLFTCFPITHDQQLVYWYMVSIGCFISQFLVFWCALWPMVAKNRRFT